MQWSSKEKKFLTRFYERTPNPTIAKALNRTVDSVRKKASRLGLDKTEDPSILRSHSSEEMLINNRGSRLSFSRVRDLI